MAYTGTESIKKPDGGIFGGRQHAGGIGRARVLVLCTVGIFENEVGGLVEALGMLKVVGCVFAPPRLSGWQL